MSTIELRITGGNGTDESDSDLYDGFNEDADEEGDDDILDDTLESDSGSDLSHPELPPLWFSIDYKWISEINIIFRDTNYSITLFRMNMSFKCDIIFSIKLCQCIYLQMVRNFFLWKIQIFSTTGKVTFPYSNYSLNPLEHSDLNFQKYLF